LLSGVVLPNVYSLIPTSKSTANGTAPSDPNQPQCILYPTAELDRVKLDSCHNYILNLNTLTKCSMKK
jgi:hypothetical protein